MLVTLCLDLLFNLAILTINPTLFIKIAPEPVDIEPAFVSVRVPTSTPYQPLHPTTTIPAVISPIETVTPIPEPSTDYYGIDFRPGAPQIKITLHPQTEKVNHGKPIVLVVNPGNPCRYQDHRACVSAYRDGKARNVIFISVHSGIGGEAETYRRAVEGIGIDRAAFSIEQIRSNLARLESAPVQIRQGDRNLGTLNLVAAGRVPPELIKDYFRSSPEQALALAAAVNPNLVDNPDPDRPILVFETCGWKLIGEPWAPGVTSTTGSVYIGVVQLAP